MKTKHWLVGLLVAGCGAIRCAGAAAPDSPRNLILVGWDGAQREHVMEGLARGELPTLKRLTEAGRLVSIDIRGKTDTKAGWSQILSGYDPDVTGVYSNARFQPVPKGLSVFERLKTHFGAGNIVTVAVIGKKQHCGEIRPPEKVPVAESPRAVDVPVVGRARKKVNAPVQPQAGGGRRALRSGGGKAARRGGGQGGAGNVPGQGPKDVGTRIITLNGVQYRVFPGSPYYYMKDGCDQWIYGLMKDEAVGTKALELIERYKDQPFFFFVHFAEVDHSGHRHGENSAAYTQALISGDTWTGKIVQKLKDLGLYDKTLVYVTADHGFNEDQKKHSNAPRVVLGANDPRICRGGDRADLTPTILDRFGVDLSKLNPPLAGHSLLRPLGQPSR